MEASFCGPTRAKNKEEPGYHFTTTDLEAIGAGLCQSLSIYGGENGFLEELKQVHEAESAKEEIIEQKKDETNKVEPVAALEVKSLMQEFDQKIQEEKQHTIAEEDNESSSGSDSEPKAGLDRLKNRFIR